MIAMPGEEGEDHGILGQPKEMPGDILFYSFSILNGKKKYTTLPPVNLRKVHNYSRKMPRMSSAKGQRKNGKTSSKNFGKTKIYDDLILLMESRIILHQGYAENGLKK